MVGCFFGPCTPWSHPLTRREPFPSILTGMSKRFLLLLLSSSAAAFSGTWMAIGDSQPVSPAAAAEGQGTELSSCEEAHEKGLAPLYAGTPNYSAKLDPDGDGLACPPA